MQHLRRHISQHWRNRRETAMLSTPLLMNYFDLKECCLLINIMIICSLTLDSEYEMKVLLSSAAETVCESLIRTYWVCLSRSDLLTVCDDVPALTVSVFLSDLEVTQCNTLMGFKPVEHLALNNYVMISFWSHMTPPELIQLLETQRIWVVIV